jgi:tetratricopeptide (TPR) repeat protein
MASASSKKPSQRSWRGRVSRWLRGRDWRRFAAALPVLGAGLALAALGVVRLGWQPTHIEGAVRERASQAFAARDYATATLALQELLQLRGDTQPDYRFRLALSLRGMGRERESAALLRTLAPVAKPVYPPAHFYLARTLLSLPNVTPVVRATAERHLAHVLALEPKNTEAHDFLGRLHLASGRLDLAKKHLMEAVGSRPDAMLPLASALRAQGDESGARSWLERAQRSYRDRLNAGASEDSEARLGLARALHELGDYGGAVDILEAALKLQNNPEYAQAVGNVCAAWATNLEKEKPTETALRLRVVEIGLARSPRHFTLLNQLAAITELSGAPAEAARKQLNEMLTDGGKVAFVHFCLGLRADQKGDLESALKHYSLAYDLAPDMIALANNLALTLAFGPRPDPERALRLMDPLVREQPKEGQLRDSRGQILLQLRRYKEAVADLEFALPLLAPAQRPSTYAALAVAYEGLGMTDVAATYAARLPGGTNSIGKFRMALPGMPPPPTPTNAPAAK